MIESVLDEYECSRLWRRDWSHSYPDAFSFTALFHRPGCKGYSSECELALQFHAFKNCIDPWPWTLSEFSLFPQLKGYFSVLYALAGPLTRIHFVRLSPMEGTDVPCDPAQASPHLSCRQPQSLYHGMRPASVESALERFTLSFY